MNSPCAQASWRDLRSFLGKQLLVAQAILPACFGPSVLWLKRIEAVKGAAKDKRNYIDFGSVRAQDRDSLANRATVTLGLRFDNHSIFGSAVSPKAGLNLRVTDYWRICASCGRGFWAPDLGRLFIASSTRNRGLGFFRRRGQLHRQPRPECGRVAAPPVN